MSMYRECTKHDGLNTATGSRAWQDGFENTVYRQLASELKKGELRSKRSRGIRQTLMQGKQASVH